jgi:anti-anti-sigma regulatory factor
MSVALITVRRMDGRRYGFVRSAGSCRAGVRGCRAGGGGSVEVGADAQITDLTVNDHACLTFADRDELFDLTAAFVRDGLAGGLKVIWLSEAGPRLAVSELARRAIAVESAMAAGQIAAARCEGRLLSGQAFSAGPAVGWLSGQVAASRREGFPGLRVAVDMSWALRPVTGVEQLPDFEEGIAAVVAGSTASVLCQYDREGFDPVTLASVAAFHTRSVAAATYYADAIVRICRQYAPPGIRLAGQLDRTRADPLALALTEAIRLEGPITVNMAGLAFIDAWCARMILDAARGLGGSRMVALQCRSQVAARFVLLGAGKVDGVIVERADDP